MSVSADVKSNSSAAILDLFPRQGEWRDGDYFALPGNRLVELVNGSIEVLPGPSLLHQFIARLMFLSLHEFCERNKSGIVMTAPTRVRVSDRHYREPDVLFISSRNLGRRQEQYWETADLVVEILSPDDPDRDLIDKRRDYANAGIPEYWIVDPRDKTIHVLTLDGTQYSATCTSQVAESGLLSGFQVDVMELFRKASE
jgi:Uma2 family endonuclease